VDLLLALAGFGVGMVVGLTGIGGGALMTPLLVLGFGVPPLAAVSSDLVASAVMKPFGGWVHAMRGTVNWSLVRWLCLGSVPSAFLGVLITRLIPSDAMVQQAIQVALGVALILAAVGLIAKAYSNRARPDDGQALEPGEVVGTASRRIRVRPLPTVLLGMVGGIVVGLTSVGSGSLIIVILLALYPALRPNDLVGTDLVQAVPLVAAAAVGHILFGDLHLDLAASIVLGSIPGVLLGARLSSRAPGGIVRAALVVMLLASAMKLFHAPNWAVLAMVVLATAAAITLLARQRSMPEERVPVPSS
jgi:uncharacterized membrane protein YfcA